MEGNFCVADINKFLWMVRIGGSTERGKHIHEMDYYTPQGEFRVDREGSPTLLNCLMYKMCYYRFGAVYTESGESHFSNSKFILSSVLRMAVPFSVRKNRLERKKKKHRCILMQLWWWWFCVCVCCCGSYKYFYV